MKSLNIIKELKDIKRKNDIAKEIVNLNMTSDMTPYEKPILPQLTQEEIDDIHARGKITAAEMVKEYEAWDLCAPGDALGSAAWRCRKFQHNCHDCLVDYVSKQKEYTSIYTVFEESEPYRIQLIGEDNNQKTKKLINKK